MENHIALIECIRGRAHLTESTEFFAAVVAAAARQYLYSSRSILNGHVLDRQRLHLQQPSKSNRKCTQINQNHFYKHNVCGQ